MCECVVDVIGGVALTEQQNLTRLIPPGSRDTEAHQTKEGGGALAHSLEGDEELVEIDRALALSRRVESGGVELEAFAASRKLVARDALQVGCVDEELLLRDPHGEDVRHVVVGNGVAIAIPIDEAIDAANAVDDTGGVVGMTRKPDQMLALVGEALEGRALVATAGIDDGVHPDGELRAHVREVPKGSAVEKRSLDFPE
jgi:hypothetical protein